MNKLRGILKIIKFLVLPALLLIGCNSDYSDTYWDVDMEGDSMKIAGATLEEQRIEENYKSYIIPIAIDAVSEEDVPATFTLCFTQEPKAQKALPVGRYKLGDYSALEYNVISCSSTQSAVEGGRNSDIHLEFDAYEILRDNNFKQIYFEEGDLYLLNNINEDVQSIGKVSVQEILPHLEVEDINYARIELEFDGSNTVKEWKLDGSTTPNAIHIPLTVQIELNGTGTDEVKLKFNDPEIKFNLALINGIPDAVPAGSPTAAYVSVPFKVVGETEPNTVKFTPAELKIEAYDTTNNKNLLDVKTIPTTDTQSPHIYFTAVLEISYTDLYNSLLPPLGNFMCLDFKTPQEVEGGHCFGNLSFAESALIENIEVITSVDIRNRTVTKSVVLDLPMNDLLDDLYDTYATIYTIEQNKTYLSRAEVKEGNLTLNLTPPDADSFSPVTYEASYSKKVGDTNSAAANMFLKAGIYTDTGSAKQGADDEQYIKAEVIGQADFHILGKKTIIMDAKVAAVAFGGNSHAMSLDYYLKILDKVVVEDGIGTEGYFSYKKNIKFEKEFTTSQSGWISFIPYTYEVGGRGEIGLGTPDSTGYMLRIGGESKIIDNTYVDTTGLSGSFAVEPYCVIDGHAFGGIGFGYSYSKWKVKFEFQARAGVGAEILIARVGIIPKLDLYIGIGKQLGASQNYLAVEVNFEAPLNYKLLQGDIYLHSKLYLQFIIDLFNVTANYNLISFNGPSNDKVHIISPKIQKWLFELP